MKLIIVVFCVVYLHCNRVGEASENKLVLKSSCICPGHSITLECTVVGEHFGATVWRGNFFDCSNGIILLHSNDRFAVHKRDCNNGSIVGRGLVVDGNCYTSQLNISINGDTTGKAIECLYDFASETFVDSLLLNTTGPFPPPSKLYVSEANVESRRLTFTWSPVAPGCLAIHYNILASNCGSCPTTTNNTTVTCTNVPTDGSTCIVALQTVVCGDIVGNVSLSDSVQVILKDNSQVSADFSQNTCTGSIIAAVLLGASCVCVTIFAVVHVIVVIKRKRREESTMESIGRQYEDVSLHKSASGSKSGTISTNENVAYGPSTGVRIDTRKNISYDHVHQLAVET